MNEADLVFTPLPQANGLVKLRPAVLLRQMPGYGDWLVCGVSSQLHQPDRVGREAQSLRQRRGAGGVPVG